MIFAITGFFFVTTVMVISGILCKPNKVMWVGLGIVGIGLLGLVLLKDRTCSLAVQLGYTAGSPGYAAAYQKFHTSFLLWNSSFVAVIVGWACTAIGGGIRMYRNFTKRC